MLLSGMFFLLVGLIAILAAVLLLVLVNIWLIRKGKQLRGQIWREYR